MHTRTVRNVASSLIGFVWTAVIALGTTPIILRGLGADAYGVQVLIGTVAGYLIVSDLFHAAGGVFIAEYQAKHDHYNLQRFISTLLWIFLGFGVLGGLIIFLLSYSFVTRLFNVPLALQEEAVWAFRLGGGVFLIGSLNVWLNSILVGLQRLDVLNGWLIANQTLAIGLSVVAVEAGWGVIGVVGAAGISSVLFFFIGVWVVFGMLRIKFSPCFDWAFTKRAVRFTAPMLLARMMNLITFQSDRAILGLSYTSAVVALYAVPLSVSVRILTLSAKANEVLVPRISYLRGQGDWDGVRRTFERAHTLNAALVTMVVVPIIVLADRILAVWVGPVFAERGSWILVALAVGYGIIAINTVPIGVIVAIGHPGRAVSLNILLGITSLVGYLIFIPIWGALGAGVAIVFGSTSAMILSTLYNRRTFAHIGFTTIMLRSLIRPIVAGVIVSIIVWQMRAFIVNEITLVLVGVCSVFAYLIAGFVFSIWTREDIKTGWTGLMKGRQATQV